MRHYTKSMIEHKPPPVLAGEGEKLTVMRSGHARDGGRTFRTSAAYVVTADGVRLVAGGSITHVGYNALARNADEWLRRQRGGVLG